MSANLPNPNNDPKTVWQNQTTESPLMTSILIRQKTQRLQTQKRQRVFACFVAPALVVFFYVFCLRCFLHLQQTAHTLFAFSLVWSIAGAFLLSRRLSSIELIENVGFSTGLEFCRDEIKRQLNYLRSALLWSFGPILCAIGTVIFVVAMRYPLFPVGIPFLVIAAAWIAAYLLIRTKQQQDLELELNELNEIEKAN